MLLRTRILSRNCLQNFRDVVPKVHRPITQARFFGSETFSEYTRTVFEDIKETGAVASTPFVSNISEDDGDVNSDNLVDMEPLAPKEELKSKTAFDGLHLYDGLVDGVLEMGIEQPTEIQQTAIPKILEGHNVICAAETGAGKTLSFLLPMLHLLKQDELSREIPITQQDCRPRGIILVPTRELVEQTLSVAKKLCHTGKFRVSAITRSSKASFPKKPIDLLVATPSSLLDYRNTGKIFTSNTVVVAVDEADTMLHEGFVEDLEALIKPLVDRRPKKKNMKQSLPPAQVILTGATVLVLENQNWRGFGRDNIKSSESWLKSIGVSDVELCISKQVNNLPEGLDYDVINTSSPDKVPAMLGVLNSIRLNKRFGSKTLIFCNNARSTRAIAHAIDAASDSNQPNTLCLHGEVPRYMRADAFRLFCDPDSDQDVLVCTDIVSRGLNFGEMVDNVIMLDLPHSLTDYIHRVGRTARAGRYGKVTMIVNNSARERKIEKQFANAMNRSRRRGGGSFVSQFQTMQTISDKEIIRTFNRTGKLPEMEQKLSPRVRLEINRQKYLQRAKK